MLCQVTGYINYSSTFENDFFLASIRAVILTVIQKKGEMNKSLKKIKKEKKNWELSILLFKKNCPTELLQSGMHTLKLDLYYRLLW